MRILPLLLALAFGSGCASNLSTLQTAKPLARGQFQVTLGSGLFVPVGQIVDVIDLGIDQGKEIKDAVDRDEPVRLTEEDQQRLLTAGLSLAVAPPGPVSEVTIRAGLADDVDVGLRYSGISLRLDTRYRFLHAGDGPQVPENNRKSFDMAIGLAGARHSFKSPVLDVLEIIQVDDFSRWDVEVPLYISADIGDIFRVYAAPKYVYSRTRLDQKLVNFAEQGKDVTGFDASLPAKVNSHFIGSTFGLSLGYKYVHVFAELTGGYTSCKPTLFGQQRNLGGATFYPAIGIAIRNLAPVRQSPELGQPESL
ncbi:MAG: hypothetical protein JXB05_00455 [Myxococcaceae bacterium]|nr:hypothetical protein [Myxococcaceae bacterium]